MADANFKLIVNSAQSRCMGIATVALMNSRTFEKNSGMDGLIVGYTNLAGIPIVIQPSIPDDEVVFEEN
jgi:hypothetical protein